MYYRRKVLLALLEALDGETSRTAFQKFLFLVCAEQIESAYHFVPYRYGCFSFQAEADKQTLTKYGLLKSAENWVLGRKEHFLSSLQRKDVEAVYRVVDQFGDLPTRELIRYVYRTYPYYAINSEIRCDILNRQDQNRVNSARPTTSTQSRLFTIGYEGQPLERYLNRLIEHDIRLLCDIRRNPVSMKFGFSKRQLQNAAQGLNIAYVHLPELGIESTKRRHLDSPEDYRLLFKNYAETTLVENTKTLNRIIGLIEEYGRVALTCFEANHHSCHRGCVVETLVQRDDFQYQAEHL